MKLLRWIEDHAALSLAAAALVVTAVQLLTTGEYPPAWFDEIEILELGRFSFFDVPPEWSVNLFAAADGTLAAPAPLFHYLSGALLEALYRLTGGFLCGRVAMLLSLPACAFALFAWLRSFGLPTRAALPTACLFLCDPNATICAHWYRPDLWCLTLTFAALVLIGRRDPEREPSPARFVLSGALLATSVFFWITSVLLLPLAVLELGRTGERRLRRAAWTAAGGLLAALVFLLPLFPHIPAIVNQYLTRSEIATLGQADAGLLSHLAANLLDFVKIALRSPFVWATALVGLCVSRRRWVYPAAFLALAAFMLTTRVYHLRMVYLMPWLFLFVAIALASGLNAARGLVRRGTAVWTLVALAAMFAISVVLLNYAAWPEANTLDAFTQRLHAAIPGATPRVYLMDAEHETYYAGRRLGWKMYSAQPRALVLDGRHGEFLATLDALVVTASGPQLTDADRAVLTAAGFSATSRFGMPPAATGALKSKIAVFVYAHGYPDCEVWSRR